MMTAFKVGEYEPLIVKALSKVKDDDESPVLLLKLRIKLVLDPVIPVNMGAEGGGALPWRVIRKYSVALAPVTVAVNWPGPTRITFAVAMGAYGPITLEAP